MSDDGARSTRGHHGERDDGDADVGDSANGGASDRGNADVGDSANGGVGDGGNDGVGDRGNDSAGVRGPRDAGYDDWLDAVAGGEPFFLRCAEGHGSLPPRRVCPHCAGELTETPLAESGTVVARTAVHVSTPQFAAEVPYVTAIAAFGAVRITGLVRSEGSDSTATGGDVPADDRDRVLSDAAVGIGDEVTVDVETPDDGQRILVFRPA